MHHYPSQFGSKNHTALQTIATSQFTMFHFLSSSAVKASLAAFREPKTPAQAKQPPIGSSPSTKPNPSSLLGPQPNLAHPKNAKRRKLLPPADIPLGKLWPAEGGSSQDRFSLTAHKVSSLAWPEEASSSSSVQNKSDPAKTTLGKTTLAET